MSTSSSSSSSYYTPTQKLLLFLQVLTTCSLSLLTQFTLKQNISDPSNTKFAYNSLTVPFFAELGKLVLSLVLFYWTREERTKTSGIKTLDMSNSTVFMAAVPASLYAISNNLNFFVIADLGAFSYQMLNQLKIVVTACAFKIMMKKHLTKLQWRMMILLTVGCMISQLGAKEGGSGEHVRFADDRHIFAGAGMTRRRGASPYSSVFSRVFVGVVGARQRGGEDEATNVARVILQRLRSINARVRVGIFRDCREFDSRRVRGNVSQEHTEPVLLPKRLVIRLGDYDYLREFGVGNERV
jgi:hypothetical protein